MTRRLVMVLLCGVLLGACELLNPLGYLQGGTSDAGTGQGGSAGGDGAAEGDATEGGDGGSCSPKPDPAHLNDAVTIAAHGPNTCALRKNGHVVCWGANADGQTGEDPAADQGRTLLPAPVQIPEAAAAIATGWGHACALGSDGAVWCWGLGASGELGSAAQVGNFGPHYLPLQVTMTDGGVFTGKYAVSAGHLFSCAIAASGVAACWGGTDYAQVGANPNDAGPTSSVPVELPPTQGALSLTTGATHGCVGLERGVLCWGSDNSGELGKDVSTSCPGSTCSWTGVGAALPSAFAPPVNSIAAGGLPGQDDADFTCAVDAHGNTFCWGTYDVGQTGDTRFGAIGVPPASPHEVGGLAPGAAVVVSAGGRTTCVLGDDGAVRCFGSNRNGLLGQGAFDAVDDAGAAPPHPTPVAVKGLSGATSISVGDDHACAIVGCGEVWCWGRNDSGQLGNGSTNDSAVPVEVGAPSATSP